MSAKSRWTSPEKRPKAQDRVQHWKVFIGSKKVHHAHLTWAEQEQRQCWADMDWVNRDRWNT